MRKINPTSGRAVEIHINTAAAERLRSGAVSASQSDKPYTVHFDGGSFPAYRAITVGKTQMLSTRRGVLLRCEGSVIACDDPEMIGEAFDEKELADEREDQFHRPSEPAARTDDRRPTDAAVGGAGDGDPGSDGDPDEPGGGDGADPSPGVDPDEPGSDQDGGSEDAGDGGPGGGDEPKPDRSNVLDRYMRRKNRR